MWVIYKKELTTFFNNLTGYLVLSVFLTVMGLFLFVFPKSPGTGSDYSNKKKSVDFFYNFLYMHNLKYG